MRSSLLLIFCFVLSCVAYSQDIAGTADSIRQANNIPAIGFAVIRCDSILLEKTMGVRKVNTTDSAGPDDRFHLGSNTKAITSFIAGTLVEERKIQWTTRVFDLFPEWEKQSRKEYSKITLQDLLSHRARIQPFTNGNEFTKLPVFEGSTGERRLAFSQWLLQQKPVKLKGKRYIYSNAGYAIATAMLEKVSGKSWETLVTETLKTKLNIDPAFSWPNLVNTNQPWGHEKSSGIQTATPPENPYKLDPMIASAGDINMTVHDYALFIQQNLRGLRGKESFLSQSTLEFIHYGSPEYAMGWGWGEKDGQHISTHDGSAGTFYCHTWIMREKDLAIIVVANAADEKTIKGIYELREYLMTLYGQVK
ncbi:MAG: hypothetical protein A2W93_13580 [Bacteroidetes bacterium GWF2_43_63]|nr:MAG: hypothetical protein A2W94_03775 [Bacteroidetes bacterium GWE2_42_42]OFY55085.1 MAG: hypothetical protein A2W93_13580 [Bacteroidetes bacterium GWF2_43_63]